MNKGYNYLSQQELLYQLLIDRGVTNPEEFLNINKTVLHNGMLLKNMDRGLNMLHWHVNNNSKIHILFDVDVDGVCSGTEIYRYIKDINSKINITFSMNNDKKHGIKLEELEEYDFDLLIVPDAGSNDIEETKILHEERDVDILILDHHKIDFNNKYAIVINCQDGIYPNPTLSGSGVVYKFIEQYDKKYHYNYSKKYIDLCAIGIVADSMDLRNYETRYLAQQGLNNITNTFILEFLKKNKKQDNKINFNFVGWKIAPFINATTRIGSKKEKIDMMKAFLESKENKEYQPRRKKKTDPKPDKVNQSMQKAMLRETTNIKSRQDRLVSKGIEKLQKIIQEQQLNKNKLIIIDATNILKKSFTGLVANKLAEYYKRPVIILKKFKDDIYGGSFRNYKLFPILSLIDFLKDLETFDMLGGHDNAGGFNIKQKNIQLTIDLANEKLKNVNIQDVYLVDYEIPIGRLKEQDILQIGKWENLWGNTLREPLFAITNIRLYIEDIKVLGSKKNFIKIEKNIGQNKIILIKRFVSEKVYNKMIMRQSKGLRKKRTSRINMNIIGKFTINKWNGSQYPQIEIIDFNVESAKEFRF